MLKFYANYGYSSIGMRNPDIDSLALLSSIQTKDKNIYANLSYRDFLSAHWKVDAAIAYNDDKNNTMNELQDNEHRQIVISAYPYNQKNSIINTSSNFIQGRAVLTRIFNRSQAMRFGVENIYDNTLYAYNSTLTKVIDNTTALFAEGDIYITGNIAAKIGVRAEYSSVLNKTEAAPRISAAYKFAGGGQINAAYGVFYQQPSIQYLIQPGEPGFMQATHYILDYQKKANNRLLRIEAYYKQYKNMVTTLPSVNSNGQGYARGIELFFRDKKTFKGFDYWITYTYLDTKRKFLNYPYEIHPDFSTPHTVFIAIKKFFPAIGFDANLSYAFATGRPYYNIMSDAAGKSFIGDNGTTCPYNNMNLSFAKLFTMFKKWKQKDFSGIGAGINNVFGSKQVFGYNYSYNGLNKLPILPPATRSYYIGLFMTFGIDRRDDFINNNL
jgi:hypothetical protein